MWPQIKFLVPRWLCQFDLILIQLGLTLFGNIVEFGGGFEDLKAISETSFIRFPERKVISITTVWEVVINVTRFSDN